MLAVHCEYQNPWEQALKAVASSKILRKDLRNGILKEGWKGQDKIAEFLKLAHSAML